MALYSPDSRDYRIEKKISKMEEKGIGQGRFENYIPWINHYMFSSQGRNTMVMGTKVKRFYELFSDLERNYFYLLEYSPQTLDIQEQKPLLDRKRCLKIAHDLNINYPHYRGSHVPYVMTSDFYIIQVNGSIAVRTVKPEAELKKKRVCEKFDIERRYYEKEGITDWKIITEKHINKTKALNIARFRNFKTLENTCYGNLEKTDIEKEIESFKELAVLNTFSVQELCNLFDQDRPSGAGFTLFKHLLANHLITIDLDKPLDFKALIKIKGDKIIVD